MRTYYPTIKDGVPVLPIHTAQSRRQWLRTLKEGTVLVVDMRIKRPEKSHQQVKAHFGLCVTMVRERMIELGYGVFNCPPSKDMVHEILTKACMGVGDHGKSIRMSSPEMTTARMAKVFENIRDFAATELQLVIPDPNPDWATITKEIVEWQSCNAPAAALSTSIGTSKTGTLRLAPAHGV